MARHVRELAKCHAMYALGAATAYELVRAEAPRPVAGRSQEPPQHQRQRERQRPSPTKQTARLHSLGQFERYGWMPNQPETEIPALRSRGETPIPTRASRITADCEDSAPAWQPLGRGGQSRSQHRLVRRALSTGEVSHCPPHLHYTPGANASKATLAAR